MPLCVAELFGGGGFQIRDFISQPYPLACKHNHVTDPWSREFRWDCHKAIMAHTNPPLSLLKCWLDVTTQGVDENLIWRCHMTIKPCGCMEQRLTLSFLSLPTVFTSKYISTGFKLESSGLSWESNEYSLNWNKAEWDKIPLQFIMRGWIKCWGIWFLFCEHREPITVYKVMRWPGLCIKITLVSVRLNWKAKE